MNDASGARVEPGLPIALVAFFGYLAIVVGLQLASGVDYDELSDSAENVVDFGLIPLAAGGVFLTALVLMAGWGRGLWIEPRGSARPWWITVPVALMAVALVMRFLGTDWSLVASDLILAAAALGVLVGFTEELLFRGIWLYCLRDGRRSEFAVMVVSSITFGLFHLPNILTGASVPQTLGQVANAAIYGATLFFVRRWAGVIVLSMVFHGAWDTSIFLSNGGTDANAFNAIALVTTVLVYGFALYAIWRVYRGGRAEVTPREAVRSG